MNKQVSIIIPTKNEEKRLGVLLPSVATQTYKNIEVIVNDDRGTSDNTSEVIKKFSKKLKIRHIYKNTGMAQGRKAGVRVAKGEFLLHLDADMKLTPKVVEDCIAQVAKGADACIIPEKGKKGDYWTNVKAFEKSMYEHDENMCSARFIKKSVYSAVGGHNPKMVLSEDKDLHLKIVSAGYKVKFIKSHLYHYEWAGLKRDLQKKYFYGRTAHVFMSEQPDHSIKQANLIFRPAFFNNWKMLLSNPLLAFGLFTLKILETIAAALGLLSLKLKVASVDPWKKK